MSSRTAVSVMTHIKLFYFVSGCKSCYRYTIYFSYSAAVSVLNFGFIWSTAVSVEKHKRIGAISPVTN